jgi:MFS family permease
MSEAMALSESPIQVLRNRRFLALWLAQLATQVGGNMVLFGLTVLVFTLTRQSTSVSLLILSFLVPAVLFGAIAGVYVDRLDRRLILVWTNVLRAFVFLGLLFASDNIVLIYLLTAALATLTTFFGPAEAAMIPVLVTRRQLLAANSLHIFTLQASFFLGFALLGPLFVILFGPVTMLWFIAALYFLAAGLCLLLPSDKPPPRAVHGATRALGEASSAIVTTFGQLRDGLRFIADHRTVFWPLTYLAITASLIGVLGVLGPGFATEVLGLSENDFVVVVLPLGVGLILGIFVLNLYGRHFSRRRGIEAGLFTLGGALVALALAQPLTSSASLDLHVSLLTIVIVVAFIAGVAYAFVAVPAQTQLQEELPSDVRGRVFGVLNMLVSVASFLPIIIVGPIADVVGTSVVVFGAAVAVLLAGVGSVLLAHPSREGRGARGLVDVADPVAVTSRSLMRPIQLKYVDGENGEESALDYDASPVIPGQAGPAPDSERQ